jgi:hypothetical protein
MQRRISTAAEVYFPKREKAAGIAWKAIPITWKSAKQIPTIGKKRSKKRGPAKGTMYVPEAQQIRIKARHIRGESMARIAREEHRDIKTVSKLIKAPDVQRHIESLKERFYGSLETMLEVAVDYAMTARDGGWLALEFLKSAGVVPDVKHASLNIFQHQPTPDEEQAAIREIAVGLIEGAIERHKFYEMPMEGLEDIGAELKQKAKLKS